MIEITDYQIFNSTEEIPIEWDRFSISNILLTIPYLKFLEKASPINFTNYFIGLYAQKELVGVLIVQKVDLQKVEHFGQRDHFLKKLLRNFLFKNFSGQLLIVGNNLISGTESFNVHPNVDPKSIGATLERIIELHFKRNVHLTILKDVANLFSIFPELTTSPSYFHFTAQPCMVFTIPAHWNSMEQYIRELSKKYRDQFKRCRRKGEGLIKKVFSVDEIQFYENEMYELYLHVANHAPFNTFFLPKNHFVELKKQLKENFRVCGYYLEGKLVGFNSIIINNHSLETYFLGYEEKVQRDQMLYLNMLYDMLEFGINDHFQSINFGRTAMEIKSSIGAEAICLDSFMQHTNPLINKYLASIYQLLEPKVEWKARHPFKVPRVL
ncbi:MAG: GNAT family N-acetyltransferase [Aquirufa sp.]